MKIPKFYGDQVFRFLGGGFQMFKFHEKRGQTGQTQV